MATIHTRTTIAPFGAITVHRAVNTLWGITDKYRAWSDKRRTITALRALSAAQLDDIGLTRADIENFGR